jgi:hypothetical protein
MNGKTFFYSYNPKSNALLGIRAQFETAAHLHDYPHTPPTHQ